MKKTRILFLKATLLVSSFLLASCSFKNVFSSVSSQEKDDSSSQNSSLPGSSSDQSSSNANSSTQSSSDVNSLAQSSSSVPSSSSDGKGSSSSSAISSSTASSSSTAQKQVSYPRIEPITGTNSVAVYNVSYEDGKYVGTQVSVLSKTDDCLTYENVCLYYMAFRQMPPNYFYKSASNALSYGTSGREWFRYNKSQYHATDYTTALGTFNYPDDGVYYELDIDLTNSYNTGSKITRGAGRVVIVAGGITDYGTDPVCYFTSDHYADFKEFYNYSGGWSPLFAGVANTSGSYYNEPTSSIARPSATTVTYTIQ